MMSAVQFATCTILHYVIEVQYPRVFSHIMWRYSMPAITIHAINLSSDNGKPMNILPTSIESGIHMFTKYNAILTY